MWGAIGGLLAGWLGSTMMGGAQVHSAQSTNQANYKMFKEANEFNEEEAEKARLFTSEQFDKSAAFNREQFNTASAYNTAMVAQQNRENQRLAEQAMGENRYLVDQAIAENRFSADRAFAENRSSAAKAMDFEERMSSTAYQRSMADLRAAGLNPMLAYAKAGASTPNAPSPQAPSPQAPSTSAPMGQAAGATMHGPTIGSNGGPAAHAMSPIPTLQVLGPALSSALQTYKTIGEIQLLRAQTRSAVRSADDAEKFGDSALGRGVGSVTRMTNTAWEAVTDFVQRLRENNFRSPPSGGNVNREPAITGRDAFGRPF